MTKRGVLVQGQLRSHKLFAKSIEKYIEVVDAAKIYSTSAWNGPAEVKKYHQRDSCSIVPNVRVKLGWGFEECWNEGDPQVCT